LNKAEDKLKIYNDTFILDQTPKHKQLTVVDIDKAVERMKKNGMAPIMIDGKAYYKIIRRYDYCHVFLGE